MCKSDTKPLGAAASQQVGPPRLLLSLDSYDSNQAQQEDDFNKKHDDARPKSDIDHMRVMREMPVPHGWSCVATAGLMIGMLIVLEQFGRYLFETDWFQQLHPLFENTTNRHILARHVFVDAFSCFVCAFLGWSHRHEWWKLMQPPSNGEPRGHLFVYHGAAYRLALFFFSYQIKNLYDTIVWGDGPEFIFHHIFSALTAYGAMTKSGGCGHGYSLFYFGISEISTAVLCLLANFDDEHGVVGLGQAMPMAKVVLGGLFAFLFILCRCILWPWTSYYFCSDIWQALKTEKPKHMTQSHRLRRGWMTFFLVALSGLSVLQVAWLGQIFVLGHEELVKAGFI